MPAEDIDLFTHFPDGFKLVEQNDLPQPPGEPKPPAPPQTIHEKMLGGLSGLAFANNMLPASVRLPDFSRIGPREVPNVSAPTIKRTSSFEVEYHIRKAKHKRSQSLDPLYIVFDSFDTVGPFGIDYRILAGNSPKEFSGRLDVIVERAL